jgi:DNA-binding response OmpR family regulator
MTILIVDDDEILGRALARGLRALGHRCLVEHAIDEALRTLAINRPDLLVTDFDLAPACTGADLACWCRNAFGVEVVMMTGAEPLVARRALVDVGLGDVDVLSKPIAIGDIVSHLPGASREALAP